MKLNFNQYILSSKQYLEYYHLKTSDEFIEYKNKNSEMNDLLLPYFYTINKSSKKDNDCFMIFYKNYLNKSDISYDWKDMDEFYEQLNNNIILKITFIIAAQYYFL